MKIPGVPPAELADLNRAQDRLSFLYLERCVIHRDSNAITATDDKGVVHIPAATLGVLMLGPGTSITQQAMMLLADNGATAIWVGEQGVRYYAHGRSLARSSRLLVAQAAAVSHRDRRLDVARAMYRMRFPGEDTSALTMQQLRGKEGARVRRCYREHAQRTGVTWNQRIYHLDDFSSGDPVNQALSAAHACLYGIVHAVIVAIGASPGLGFVHTGHERSFVYDIADFYKAEITIPAAFDIAASESADISGDTRRAIRDRVHDGAILDRCVRDIRSLLLTSQPTGPLDDELLDEETGDDMVRLWDETGAELVGGKTTAAKWTSDDRHHPHRMLRRSPRSPHPVAAGDIRGRVRRTRQQPHPPTAVEQGHRHGRARPRASRPSTARRTAALLQGARPPLGAGRP